MSSDTFDMIEVPATQADQYQYAERVLRAGCSDDDARAAIMILSTSSDPIHKLICKPMRLSDRVRLRRSFARMPFPMLSTDNSALDILIFILCVLLGYVAGAATILGLFGSIS